MADHFYSPENMQECRTILEQPRVSPTNGYPIEQSGSLLAHLTAIEVGARLVDHRASQPEMLKEPAGLDELKVLVEARTALADVKARDKSLGGDFSRNFLKPFGVALEAEIATYGQGRQSGRAETKQI